MSGALRAHALLALLCGAFGGCATLECNTQWYETGRRDGLIGAPPQTQYYSDLCGDRLDLLLYLDGWHVGSAMRPRQPAP